MNRLGVIALVPRPQAPGRAVCPSQIRAPPAPQVPGESGLGFPRRLQSQPGPCQPLCLSPCHAGACPGGFGVCVPGILCSSHTQARRCHRALKMRLSLRSPRARAGWRGGAAPGSPAGPGVFVTGFHRGPTRGRDSLARDARDGGAGRRDRPQVTSAGGGREAGGGEVGTGVTPAAWRGAGESRRPGVLRAPLRSRGPQAPRAVPGEAPFGRCARPRARRPKASAPGLEKAPPAGAGAPATPCPAPPTTCPPPRPGFPAGRGAEGRAGRRTPAPRRGGLPGPTHARAAGRSQTRPRGGRRRVAGGSAPGWPPPCRGPGSGV